jgi:two-component system phosphate regulon sensor histidine kinase PhoR
MDALQEFSPEAGAGTQEPFRVSWPEPKRELEVVLQPLADEQGRPGVLVVLHDITRRAHLEKVRTDFISNLSHELRTPLTAVRGAAETLQDGALDKPEVAERFLETIRRHSVRLENLLADVSDLARVEAGADTNQVTRFDAWQPVHQVVDLFTTEAERRELRLEAVSDGTELPLWSDPVKIEAVLVNLVQNSLRYTGAGGRVRVSVESIPDGVRYRVVDDGIGIPPGDLPRITERFYRVDPSRSRAQGGTGLGLSIAKHQAEELGGHLSIQSEYGVGTKVVVTLPALPLPGEPAGEE